MKKDWLTSDFFRWKDKNLRYRRFVIIISLVVGLGGGLAAVLLKNLVHYTHEGLMKRVEADSLNILYFALPFIGILLTILFVRFFIKDDISHGVSRILFAISRKNGILKAHNTWSSLVASTLTVGFGGSVGLEAPIVLTGSAIGSRISKLLRLNYKTTVLMLGCGAAGAIAGIFKAPIAALVFALEVLMLDLTMWSIIPLMISSVTGATISYFLSGKGVIFSFSSVDAFVMGNIPYYLLLGLVTGLISVYVTWGTRFIENQYSRINKVWKKLMVGGLVLSLLIFLFPPLYGEGYNALRDLMTGNAIQLTNGSLFYNLQDNIWMLLVFLFLVMILKVIAMAVTNGSGGVGGVFAPSLFIGGFAGFITSNVINKLGFINVSEKNFTLVGMAGVMAGVMHAPLTAIFLIAELTGGYALFIPLIITSAIAYLTTIFFIPHSIYTERLAKRGELITHHKDRAVLTLLNVKSVIEKDLVPVHPDAKLGDLIRIISKSKRNLFPVVDEENFLHGIILLDNIRDIIFNHEMYDSTFVSDLMVSPPATIEPDEPMNSVMEKFEETGAWNLPVTHEGRYYGFISKARIFNKYRKLLVQFSDE
jgi:CIC family chloride channel protein